MKNSMREIAQMERLRMAKKKSECPESCESCPDMRKAFDMPVMAKITKIVDETPTAKTFFIDHAIEAEPGQFVMVWIPGIDEKPFAISYLGKNPGLTAVLRGAYTQEMFKLKIGDRIGARGPYGKGFEFSKKEKACVIAGGIGVTEVITLIEELKKPTVILGAKTANEIVFEKQIKKHAGEFYITTDDGSKGIKGYTTDVFRQLVEEKKKKFDIVYTCGPEFMMLKIFELCEKYKINYQASLERYMKCAFGVCGECAMDGSLVCMDGPVYKREQIRKFTELGKIARLKSGREVSLKEYFMSHG